ncbi:hypothetical protein BDN70DRAFT_885704, partial [Pholiota conissans]
MSRRRRKFDLQDGLFSEVMHAVKFVDARIQPDLNRPNLPSSLRPPASHRRPSFFIISTVVFITTRKRRVTQAPRRGPNRLVVRVGGEADARCTRSFHFFHLVLIGRVLTLEGTLRTALLCVINGDRHGCTSGGRGCDDGGLLV